MDTTGLGGTITSTALGASIPLQALAPIAFIAVCLVALLVAYGFVQFWFGRYKSSFGRSEEAIQFQFSIFSTHLFATPVIYGNKVVEAVNAVTDLLRENWINLALVIILGFVGYAWNREHTAIVAVAHKIYVCDVVPLLYDWPLYLANLARSLYDAIIPLWNLWHDWSSFFLTGWRTILKSCALAEADIKSLLDQVGAAAAALGTSIATFFQGDIFHDRWPLETFVHELGLAVNLAYEPLACFCEWLGPVWRFVTQLPQIPALEQAVSAAVNTGIRLLQTILNPIVNDEPIMWSSVAAELILFVIEAGNVVQLAAILVYNMLTDFLNEIGLLAMSEPEVTQQVFKLNGAEPTLSNLLHSAAYTRASPMRFGESFDASSQLSIARKLIWEYPPGTNLSDVLGLPVILTLLQTEWTHPITETVAAAIIIVNMTMNIISNPITALTGGDSLAYFQVGPIFDRLRNAWDALSGLLTLFDPNLPAVASYLGQAVLTYYEGLAELFFGTVFAIIHPTWSFGVPAPVDCTLPGACTYDTVPPDWTIFLIYPDYYDWEDNAIKRTIRLLDQDADALAILLACNETSLADDDCTDRPFQCFLRTTYLLVNEVVNQTAAALFYLPDLVQFDANVHTFQDIALARLQDLFYLAVECLTTWYFILFLLFDDGKTGTGGYYR
jgi:hypothetical protein